MITLSYKRSLFAIFLVAMATLMFELLVNKALSFSTWGGLGYMIIGSAIFGYSIAGVAIAIWKPHEKYSLSALMSYAAIGLSLSMVLCYVVMNVVPFGFGNMYYQPLTHIFYFTIWYVALLVPFSLSGFIIALLLTVFKDQSNRLYASDLVGAGLGCLIVVPLFPSLGAAGLYLACAALAAGCAFVFAYGTVRKVMVGGVLSMVVLGGLAPFAQSLYPVQTHDIKRDRGADFDAGFIEHSLWSFLSKIEVAIVPDTNRGTIWFDGGLMQSNIDRFDGNYDAERQTSQVSGPNSLAYRLTPRDNVLIIAPAGGREVRAALAWGAAKVTGVELDTSVVELVQEELNDHLGGIYQDSRVTLINDEGRSFVRRSTDLYDTIQFVSAYSVHAQQSGALDLSSSFLMTEEALQDYLDHLTPDGVLALSYGSSLRLLFSVWEALEQRGLDPSERVVMVHNDNSTLTANTIFAKLTPFTSAELEVIKDASLNRLPINYAPPALMAEVDRTPGLVSQPKTRNLIELFVETLPMDREEFYATFPYRVQPVTDNKPFFNNFRYLGVDIRQWPERLTEELDGYIAKQEYIPRLPLGSVAQIIVLAEAAVLAVLFLIFPLWKFKSDGIRTRPQKLSLIYFLSLGLGFIWIEVVLLKVFVLFVGSPVYSIAVVLFAMLVFAGLGSFYSERLRGDLRQKLLSVGAVLAALVLCVAFIYPQLFQVFLAFPFPARVLTAIALIAPVGFVLGMPFPIGLSVLAKSSPESIPWAWAMNGYATVIGISSAALIALKIGFALLLICSLAAYLIGFLSLLASSRQEAAQLEPIEAVA
jgi:predicted membrane-bound spermidine synthase